MAAAYPGAAALPPVLVAQVDPHPTPCEHRFYRPVGRKFGRTRNEPHERPRRTT
ncbi:hypothetical protein ACFPM0_03250 [Pseudonocardia sulfidoxydans]|uniref:hypothetical protein n=1 Tax=Pseudonocardia sulfidoxydans TaxID=54011 RepID=UPI00360A0C1A